MAQAPQSAYRSWIGVCKDTINANLSASTASVGATTLTLTNLVGTTGTLSTSGSLYSAVIVDGPNTEITVLSGNLASNNVTCGALAYAHSANTYVFFQLTSALGPSAYIPATKIDFSDNYDNKLYDKGYRGSQNEIYGAQQGLRLGNFSYDFDAFADTLGYTLSSFFGAYDYTASTASAPTTYAFSPANAASVNGQPGSYLFFDYNPGNNNLRVFAKAVISDLSLKFDPAALVSGTASGTAFASGVVAGNGASVGSSGFTVPTPSFSNFTPVPARLGAATLGGTYTQDMMTAEYTLKREEFGAINTVQGIQDPLSIFSGPVSCAVKFSMVQADDTQLNAYINQTQPTFEVKAVRGTGNTADGIDIFVEEANYEDVKVVQSGKAYVTLDGNFTAIGSNNANVVTNSGGGYSPVKVTISVKGNTGASQY